MARHRLSNRRQGGSLLLVPLSRRWFRLRFFSCTGIGSLDIDQAAVHMWEPG